MAYYKDLREYIQALEEKDLLVTIRREINKDTELHPLVRWQFRGLPEEKRKAFIFENVTDSKGRKYEGKVAVAILGGSDAIYALAMNCRREDIFSRWVEAQRNPIEPIVINSGPAQEEVHLGTELNEPGGGLEEFPIPISTPGFDPSPYITAPCIISKDPETGNRNVGTYRVMIKGRTKTGMFVTNAHHLGMHWEKCKARGKDLEAAICLGAVPAVGLCSAAKFPYVVDELAVAGGIAGEPIPLVRCKTIDLEVPATSEIVIEGTVTTRYLEPEAPFGEFTGYMGERVYFPWFEVKCITHRKSPIYHSFISQFPPSESSKLRKMGREGSYYKLLKYDCNIPAVMDVVFHEESGSSTIIIIQMKKTNNAQPWQALNAAVGFDPRLGKIFIAVDEDINPRNIDTVMWAVAYRIQPHLDIQINMGRYSNLDPSSAPMDSAAKERLFPSPRGNSAMLIDATRKWPYPPTSLPGREFMEQAKKIWEEEGLPRLTPQEPWYGVSLGYWSKENEEEAAMATKGDYLLTAEKLAKQIMEV